MQDGKQFSFHSEMLLADDLAVVGTDVSTGHVYAFDVDSGTARWKLPEGAGVYADICGDRERAFAVTLEDTVVCFETRTGKVLWTYSQSGSLGEPRNERSPALSDSLLLYVDLRGNLVALRAATGELAWQLALDTPILTSVSVSNGSAYVGTEDGRVHRIHAALGIVLAELDIRGPSAGFVCGEKAILTLVRTESSGGRVKALAKDLGEVLWERDPPPEDSWTTFRPAFWRGWAVAGTAKGGIWAFDLEHGSPAWTLELDGVVKSLGTSGDELYAGTQDGLLHVYRSAR